MKSLRIETLEDRIAPGKLSCGGNGKSNGSGRSGGSKSKGSKSRGSKGSKSSKSRHSKGSKSSGGHK